MKKENDGINAQHRLNGRPKGDLRQKDDFYPTPEYVTRILMDRIPFDGTIWECACGDGAMSEVIKSYGHHVVSTDLVGRGYNDGTSGIDFLFENTKMANIVTNPPFNLAYEFIEQGLRLSCRKLALLLPVRYLTGKKRTDLYKKTPPKYVIIIPNKVDFLGYGNPAMEFAWFVWDKSMRGGTELLFS